jgi:hypothetical protein
LSINSDGRYAVVLLNLLPSQWKTQQQKKWHQEYDDLINGSAI